MVAAVSARPLASLLARPAAELQISSARTRKRNKKTPPYRRLFSRFIKYFFGVIYDPSV